MDDRKAKGRTTETRIMKELKFRAYHKIQKRMFHVFGVGKDFLTEDTIDGIDPGNNCFQGSELDDIVVMQFTGFKDKLGNDIYDGDIISDKVDVDGEIVESKQQVFWNEFTGSYHMDNSYEQDKSVSEELWTAMNDFHYEVIGNVYEHIKL